MFITEIFMKSTQMIFHVFLGLLLSAAVPAFAANLSPDSPIVSSEAYQLTAGQANAFISEVLGRPAQIFTFTRVAVLENAVESFLGLSDDPDAYYFNVRVAFDGDQADSRQFAQCGLATSARTNIISIRYCVANPVLQKTEFAKSIPSGRPLSIEKLSNHTSLFRQPIGSL